MKNILITESQLKSIQEMHINGESLYYDNTQILNEEEIEKIKYIGIYTKYII